MVAFGCATNDERRFRAHARPGVERVAERDSVLLRRHGHGSVQQPYNEMLEQACEYDSLEAVVLLHEDLSIDDESFLSTVRGLLAASPDVAVIGTVGARGARGLAWWEGECHGYVDLPDAGPSGRKLIYSRGAHEVDMVDGRVLVLSAWAARELRFDGQLADSSHGHDIDICLQARARGRRVVACGLGVSDRTREGFPDRHWVQADAAVRRKWGGATG